MPTPTTKRLSTSMRATRGSVSTSIHASPFSRSPQRIAAASTPKKTNYTLSIMSWLAAIVDFLHNIWMQHVLSDYRHHHHH